MGYGTQQGAAAVQKPQGYTGQGAASQGAVIPVGQAAGGYTAGQQQGYGAQGAQAARAGYQQVG